jgi:hypothetical protein
MKAKVRLQCERGPEIREGEVLGPFAVVFFPQLKYPDRPYSVTHIPSGLAAARTRTKKHGLHIARRLRAVPVEWDKVSEMIDWAKVSEHDQRLLNQIRLDALLA